MKTIILFILALPCIALSQIQNSIYPVLPYTNYHAIAAEGDHIFLSGSCGIGSVSKDGGDTYENFELDETIIDIAVIPGTNGAQAYYLTKEILYSLDINTKALTAVTDASLSFLTGSFRAFELINDHVYLIASSTIYFAPVGSDDWQQLCEFTYENNDYNNVNDASENNLYIGSRNGLLSKVSLQDGTITMLKDYGNRIGGIAMATDDIGYTNVSGISGADKTTDGWNTSTNITTLEGIGLITYGENIVMSVNTNRLYVSMDQGLTSTYIPTPNDGNVDLINGTTVLADGTIYFVGRSAMVLKTENFGASFQNLNEYKRARLSAIEIGDNGVGYAAGANGTMILTRDGGENWEPIAIGIATDSYISDIAIVDNGRTLVAHDNGLAIVENEAMVSSQTNTFELLLYNELDKYIIGLQNQGGEFVIQKSLDNGDTWESKGRIPPAYFISQSPTGKIYIPNGEDITYVSTDGGETWSTESYGLSSVRMVHFLNETHGLIVDGGTLYQTKDGGETVNPIASGYSINNIQYFDENHILYTTGSNNATSIRTSDDGGASFKTTGSFCTVSTSSYFDGIETVWFGQQGGHINKHKVDLLPSATTHVFLEKFEVYPNPVAKGEDLIVNLEGMKEATVSLYSVSGQLASRINLTGETAVINLNEVTPGLYFLNIQSKAAQVNSTQKVLVVD